MKNMSLGLFLLVFSSCALLSAPAGMLSVPAGTVVGDGGDTGSEDDENSGIPLPPASSDGYRYTFEELIDANYIPTSEAFRLPGSIGGVAVTVKADEVILKKVGSVWEFVVRESQS